MLYSYPGLTYFFLFFIPIGIYPSLISLCSWIGNNLAPSWKRAVGMALVVSGGNLGGLVGSNIFLESQSPKYPLGYGLCVSKIPSKYTRSSKVADIAVASLV